MSVVKLACGASVMAILAGTTAAHVPASRWGAFYDYARGMATSPPNGSPVVRASSSPRTDPGVQRFNAGPQGVGSVTLTPDRFGQYHAEMDVEGRRVPVLIDTGASFVSLSYETANALGFFPAPADFTWRMHTANGVTSVAPIEIGELHVGPIVARHVKAVVSERGALAVEALLGMSFLHELAGFSVDQGRLVLTQ